MNAKSEIIEKKKRTYHRKPKQEQQSTIGERYYYTSTEVAELLGCSLGHAYAVIRGLNMEYQKLGYLTQSAKVSKSYFHQRFGF